MSVRRRSFRIFIQGIAVAGKIFVFSGGALRRRPRSAEYGA
jgi:hypothetical protein